MQDCLLAPRRVFLNLQLIVYQLFISSKSFNPQKHVFQKKKNASALLSSTCVFLECLLIEKILLLYSGLRGSEACDGHTER